MAEIMDKELIKEAILGKKGCRKEETPLCWFATFNPDMEMVEILLKGADVDASFNGMPLLWVWQFCRPNMGKMLELLFKYKYYGLHLRRYSDFVCLLSMLELIEKDRALGILEIMKKHKFVLSDKQREELYSGKYESVCQLYESVWGAC